MGIILGALAGAGGQMADAADKSIAQDYALQRNQQESDLALQRAQALEEFKVQMQNTQRTAMVGRLNDAAGNIADQQMAPIQQQEQAGITDPSSWTPEQQAAVDQSNGMRRQGIVQQALSDGSAGLASGDIAPEKAMENTSRLQINQLKIDNLLERANDRNQTLQEIMNVRAEAMRYTADMRVEAAKERALNGQVSTALTRMQITGEDANIRSATTLIGTYTRQLESLPRQLNGKPNPQVDDVNAKIADLEQDIKQSKANKAVLTQMLNVPGAGGTPGGAGAPKVGNSPYPEGTKLTGPGGAPYIVRGGQPVPVGQ